MTTPLTQTLPPPEKHLQTLAAVAFFEGYRSRREFCALGCLAASDVPLAKGQQTTDRLSLSASTEQDQAKSVGQLSKATTGADEIFHVAIFRFAKEHVKDAMAAFRELASASRRESGNISYDIYRGIDDDQEFYVAEHWASQALWRSTNALKHSSTSVRAY